MKLLALARSVAVNAMLVFVVMASLTGAACDTRCAQASASHRCCAMLDGNCHHGASLASAMVCHHPANLLPADLAPLPGLVAGFMPFRPIEPVRVQVAFELQPATVSASPPKFHLRI
ncbi:MAG: hypothetical protein WA634_20850 [Silvibacterium sp.]